MGKQTHAPRTRVSMNTRTEVLQDTRTARERTRGQEKRATLEREMDEMLDEIDGVLEENAQAFVDGYVQKGGE
jgi:ubiquitin-like protein Pup